ncbi:37528_t:CDS:2, partial [Gigaspora margarita]
HEKIENDVENVEPPEHDAENDELYVVNEKIENDIENAEPVEHDTENDKYDAENDEPDVANEKKKMMLKITLESYKIKQNDTINIFHKNNVEKVTLAEYDDVEKIDDKQTIKPADKLHTKCYQNDTILGLKKKLQSMLGIDIKKISLSFSGKPLEDHRTLESYKIKQNNTIYVSRRIIGGALDYFVLTNDYLDPRYDNDFQIYVMDQLLNVEMNHTNHLTGGKELQSILKGTDKNSWPVSFHGTSKGAAENIVKYGFDLSKRKCFAYGKGIYSTPDIKEAEFYAKQFFHQNREYKVIFQNRVDPSDLRKANHDLYWITADDKNIRPYSICIKK